MAGAGLVDPGGGAEEAVVRLMKESCCDCPDCSTVAEGAM